MTSSAKFVFQQTHHDIVVPGAVYKGCLAFSAFLDKAAFPVGANCPLVVAQHTNANAMKSQGTERVSEQN